MRSRFLESAAAAVVFGAVACSASGDSAGAGGTGGTCAADQFRCGSGECMPTAAWCNGSPDCADQTDELSCTTGCQVGEFQCGSGECRPLAARCNGSYDCADYGDEAGCPRPATGGSGGGAEPPTGGTGGGVATGGSGGAAPAPGQYCAQAFASADAAGRRSGEYQTWKSAYVRDCGTSACVADGNWVVSEGIGYGMLLAAGHDDQALFDKLWRFYTDHLDNQGLMNWSMDACTAAGNNNANAATDGDLDAAMALVQADARWGGYQAAALGLIQKIKQYETATCSNGMYVLKPGDVWGGCNDPGDTRLNPSYFAPGYYRVFASVDAADAAFWTKLATDTYTLLARYQNSCGGLVGEWAHVDDNSDCSYGYNACRTPWRVAVDYLWFCTPEAAAFLGNASTYVDSHGGIAGVPFDKNSAFLGAFALSGAAVSQAKLDGYVSAWLATATAQDNRYFQSTLRVLYLDAAAEQFPSTL